MSSHYLLHISDLYCILCSQFIFKNAAVHAAASVNIKDETWNNDFDAKYYGLEDIMDTNNWSDVEETALAHDLCIHQDIDNSDRSDAVESKENGGVESDHCFQNKAYDCASCIKDNYSAFVRNDDDSAFVQDNASANLRDDDSAFVRNDSKLPKPSSSWSQPPLIINVEEQSTEDKKPLPREMTMKPSEEE